MGIEKVKEQLHHLARLHGVQTAYYDVAHRRKPASVDSMLAVLGVLGAPVSSSLDVAAALRQREQALAQRIIEPVVVAWDGRCPVINVRLPSVGAGDVWQGGLETEDMQRYTWQWRVSDLPFLGNFENEGIEYVERGIAIEEVLSPGYHRLTLEVPGKSLKTLVIAAPVKTYIPSRGAEDRVWGAFIPLYALYGKNSWGSGDFYQLEAMMEWLGGMGGQVLVTLPLLPAFLDEPFEPSPYAPVSRLFWNEFYLDINTVPELAKCPPAQALLQSTSFQDKVKEQRLMPLVDYRRQMTLKRRVLEELGRCLLAEKSSRLEDFRCFVRENPAVEDYARFRAVMEKRRESWPSWPEDLRSGSIKEGDFTEKARHYHMYAQWLTCQQVEAFASKSRESGGILYSDLPVGVHPEGYDVWREQGIFGLEASVGAPPDSVFTNGQDWKFPPLHPERVREQGYGYFIAYIRHHLRHAGMLRIDHVMGLHRLFWLPKGLGAKYGVYVRYHDEELYAILALESNRYKSIIVGEDLGTVPSYVRPTMARHRLQHMYVVHYELASNAGEALNRIPRNSVASLNTHDMPTFLAFWEGLDIEQRLELGMIDRKGASAENKERRAQKRALTAYLRKRGWLKGGEEDSRTIFQACLSHISDSQGRVVLINLEDLWSETSPQNIPGQDKYPNWQKKARYAFDDFCQMPQVIDTLREVNRLRKGRHG